MLAGFTSEDFHGLRRGRTGGFSPARPETMAYEAVTAASAPGALSCWALRLAGPGALQAQFCPADRRCANTVFLPWLLTRSLALLPLSPPSLFSQLSTFISALICFHALSPPAFSFPPKGEVMVRVSLIGASPRRSVATTVGGTVCPDQMFTQLRGSASLCSQGSGINCVISGDAQEPFLKFRGNTAG